MYIINGKCYFEKKAHIDYEAGGKTYCCSKDYTSCNQRIVRIGSFISIQWWYWEYWLKQGLNTTSTLLSTIPPSELKQNGIWHLLSSGYPAKIGYNQSMMDKQISEKRAKKQTMVNWVFVLIFSYKQTVWRRRLSK